MARMLQSLGYDLTGVDGDEGGIQIAWAMFPNVRFEVRLFSDPPPGQFDMVCSTEVIELLYAPHELVRYCHDALKSVVCWSSARHIMAISRTLYCP